MAILSDQFPRNFGLLNNNTIDGGDNNQAFFAEERGRTRLSYSIANQQFVNFRSIRRITQRIWPSGGGVGTP